MRIACEDETWEDEEERVVEEVIKGKKLEVSLNSSSIVGIDSPKTMKFIRIVKEKNVSTTRHQSDAQFHLKQMMTKLQIPIRPTNFVMVLGDHRKVK